MWPYNECEWNFITYAKKSFIARAIAWFTSKIGKIDKHRVSHALLYLGEGQTIESTIGGVKLDGLKGYKPDKFRLYIARPVSLTQTQKKQHLNH